MVESCRRTEVSVKTRGDHVWCLRAILYAYPWFELISRLLFHPMDIAQSRRLAWLRVTVGQNDVHAFGDLICKFGVPGGSSLIGVVILIDIQSSDMGRFPSHITRRLSIRFH